MTSKSKIDFDFTKDAFISNIFEMNYHLSKAAVDCSAYTWNQFSTEFHGIEPMSGNVRVFADNQIQRDQYTSGEQDGPMVIHHFDAKKLEKILSNGATIVINRFDRFSIYAFDLCMQISELTGNTTVGNAYITLGGNGAFGKHWDTHCVFAIQMKGRKRWKIFKPTLELPLKFQTSLEDKPSFNGAIVFDDIITEGDILYVPRGWWHETIPLKKEASLHMAVGVHTPKIFEFIQWLVREKISSNITFRRSMKLAECNNDILHGAFEEIKKEMFLEENMESFFKEKMRLSKIKKPIDFCKIFTPNEK